ncbi:MAG TPA: ATP-binding protein [Trebonia sp.]|jgi:two-component system sensor histidine kinase KdpD|nr:ATP-binding protein [Trebonia sp.]
MRRTFTGTVVALAGMAVVTAIMLPLRGSMSIATTALILVIPVVIGVVTGGFAAGAVSVIAGFLVYDFFFIPPYLTLYVGAPENWVALGVYVVVMLPVARVVAGMNLARAKELRQGRELRELFELSDLLVGDKPLDVLLPVVVTSLADVSGARQVALFLPAGTRLEIAALAGDPLSDEQLREVLPFPGTPATLQPRFAERPSLAVLALTASGRPVGLLALSADAAARHEREPLLLFANHIALAVERAQLREAALRTRVNAEMARLAKTLVAAVAHDLRAPLASLKASSSTLADPGLVIGARTRQELAVTIDAQADRLASMVTSLLDMSRIQAGVLRPRRAVFSPDALVSDVMGDPPPSWQGHEIRREVAGGLPPADADPVLIARVLANLVDNAVRHSPAGAPVTIRVGTDGETIGVSVTDAGPGVPPARREEIFGLFPRREHDAGAGLGLTIARTFVEAHGQRIWVEDAPGGGARFCFTLPVAAAMPEEQALPEGQPTPEETRLAARAHH